MFHACKYFPSPLLLSNVSHHILRSFTILTSSSVQSPSPINLRTSLSISTSSVDPLFVNVLIKTGMECTTKSFAFLTGSLSKWNYGCEYMGKFRRLAMMSYTCTLWTRQDRFRTIRKFALTFGTLILWIVVDSWTCFHFPATKFAVDADP